MTNNETPTHSAKNKLAYMPEELHKQLNRLIDQQCQSVFNKSDNSLQLNFGDVIKRICSEKEKAETEKEKEFLYENEYDILIWCAWRLENSENYICSSESTIEQREYLTKQLIGQTVRSIELFPPAWDAIITFSSEQTLRIFCIYSKDSTVETNWFFRNVETLYCIDRANKIVKTRIN
jgi:hypothetical protein